MTLADREVQRRDQLRIEQAMWIPLWKQCTDFCCPHKQKAVDNSYAQLTQQVRARFNPWRQTSTAIDALNVLSGGCKTWLLPGGDEGWGGVWAPDPARENSDAVKDWLMDCTQRSIAPLEKGGFFTSGHEMFQDLGVFGTTGFLIDEGDDENPLYCQALMPTNFVFERDWTGQVIRVIITWSKPATLIKDQFNLKSDNVPQQVLTDCEANNGQAVHELIQSIYRRSDTEMKEYRPNEPAGQRYGSCWIHVSQKQVIRERGYMEMPFTAPRWNTWAGTGPSNYGTSPAMQALADCKGLNLLDMVIATRSEIEINPRVKVMPDQTSPVDLSPGGITQMNSLNGVQEWAAAGSYPIGKDQIETLERRINRAFFKDLFEAVTPIAQQREMNIPVMDAVQREAAARITPAMGRIETDFYAAAMMRVFMVLLRAGVFEDPPEEAFEFDSADQSFLVLPRVIQANKWTRTINARKSIAFQQMMARRQAQVALGHPEVMDDLNFEAINSDLDRGDGAPQEWKFTPEQVAQNRAIRAKAQQEQAIQQTMLDAAGKNPMQVAQIATGNIKAA